MGVFDQDGFAARFEWGQPGLRTLLPHVDLTVIVDVLSFSTAVDVATARGACVLPYAWRDESAAAFATKHAAVLAVNRYHVSAEQPYSLSPSTLAQIPPQTRVVLPSPNGSTLTTLAAEAHRVASGCLRNARAVGTWACTRTTVAVIAAGELRRDGTLRFAIEDLLGAGAILSHWPKTSRSPEAEVAVATFQHVEHELPNVLAQCASGREITAAGFPEDVAMAAELDVSDAIPVFVDPGWYANVSSL
ncbi:MAG: 2-phosphosulfolactate phosphatase [Chloroflexi bacterium]|nr:2-phosphosulfolactate phosphatase [Chloroflexota bacterium]